jgi:hypothetical protein
MQLNWFLFHLLTSFALLPGCYSQNTAMKKIEKNGMTVEWEWQDESLLMRLAAPTGGWLAVGFNLSNELSGTNLIMAAVAESKVRLSDRFIVAPGDHRSMADMGGIDGLVLMAGSEKDGQTSVLFRVPSAASDQFHFNLSPGKRFHLLMAYSLEDDFMHHSVMRTSIEITL